MTVKPTDPHKNGQNSLACTRLKLSFLLLFPILYAVSIYYVYFFLKFPVIDGFLKKLEINCKNKIIDAFFKKQFYITTIVLTVSVIFVFIFTDLIRRFLRRKNEEKNNVKNESSDAQRKQKNESGWNKLVRCCCFAVLLILLDCLSSVIRNIRDSLLSSEFNIFFVIFFYKFASQILKYLRDYLNKSDDATTKKVKKSGQFERKFFLLLLEHIIKFTVLAGVLSIVDFLLDKFDLKSSLDFQYSITIGECSIVFFDNNSMFVVLRFIEVLSFVLINWAVIKIFNKCIYRDSEKEGEKSLYYEFIRGFFVVLNVCGYVAIMKTMEKLDFENFKNIKVFIAVSCGLCLVFVFFHLGTNSLNVVTQDVKTFINEFACLQESKEVKEVESLGVQNIELMSVGVQVDITKQYM